MGLETTASVINDTNRETSLLDHLIVFIRLKKPLAINCWRQNELENYIEVCIVN